VVDLSTLIRTISERDDHPRAPPASTPPVPLRWPAPACPGESCPTSAARRVQTNGASAQIAHDGSPRVGGAGQSLDRLEASTGLGAFPRIDWSRMLPSELGRGFGEGQADSVEGATYEGTPRSGSARSPTLMAVTAQRRRCLWAGHSPAFQCRGGGRVLDLVGDRFLGVGQALVGRLTGVDGGDH
jgi:hypothetical protein